MLSVINESGGPRQRRADLAYYEAKVLWAQEKTAEAKQRLEVALARGPSETYVETLLLKGAVSAGSGEYEMQATVLLEALRATLSDRHPNVWKWATITAQLCQLARDLPDRSVRDAALENVDRVPWTPDLRRRNFRAARAIAWRYAQEGNHFSAFRYLKKAEILADAPTYRILVACDRAYFADALGEWRWAEQEIEEAQGLIESVDWGHPTDDERFALLRLAEACAPHDGTRAQSYLFRFHALDPEALSSGELRARAAKAYTLAHVHQLLNEFSEAENLYKQAFDFYDRVGFDWRAGRTAIGLAQFSKESESARWRAIARQKLEHYPHSWLTEQLKGLEGYGAPIVRVKRRSKTGAPTDLSPAQNEVYELLLRGLSATEVAKELERSVFTVRNHMKALFKKLGVKSRASLMAKSLEGQR
jgi:DNA-binding CsgD family transcriptional regulator